MKRLIVLFAVVAAVVLYSSTGIGTEADSDRPRVQMQTSVGTIVVELFPDSSPITVENFLQYVDEGFYDGTVFHRVIADFMIQGGGLTEDMSAKPTRDGIRNESRNKLHNERGTIAMARTSDPDSATSQFYINVRNNLRLDFDYVTRRPGYTVFGRVVDGMDVVDAISLVETGPQAGHQDVPLEPVVIESVTRL